MIQNLPHCLHSKNICQRLQSTTTVEVKKRKPSQLSLPSRFSKDDDAKRTRSGGCVHPRGVKGVLPFRSECIHIPPPHHCTLPPFRSAYTLVKVSPEAYKGRELSKTQYWGARARTRVDVGDDVGGIPGSLERQQQSHLSSARLSM